MTDVISKKETTSELVACTIIVKNYLAQARVLSRSFHNPDARMFVLIVDDLDGYLDPEKEPFQTVWLEELPIDDLPSSCFKYLVLELSTTVKPFFRQHIFGRYRRNALHQGARRDRVLGCGTGLARSRGRRSGADPSGRGRPADRRCLQGEGHARMGADHESPGTGTAHGRGRSLQVRRSVIQGHALTRAGAEARFLNGDYLRG